MGRSSEVISEINLTQLLIADTAGGTVVGSAIKELDGLTSHASFEVQNNDTSAADDLQEFALDIKYHASGSFVEKYSGSGWDTETTRVKSVSDGANLSVLGDTDKCIVDVFLGNAVEIRFRAQAAAGKTISELKILGHIWRA